MSCLGPICLYKEGKGLRLRLETKKVLRVSAVCSVIKINKHGVSASVHVASVSYMYTVKACVLNLNTFKTCFFND